MKSQHLFTEGVSEWSFRGSGCTDLAEPMKKERGKSVNQAATELGA